MPQQDAQPRNSKLGWGELIGLLLLAGAVVLIVWPRERALEPPPVPPGTPLPPLMIQGWLGKPPAASLRGQVVVVDCWATFCIPCREALPEMARLYAAYHPLGVEFVGLTPEPERDVPMIRRFLESTPGVDWPVGYGADATMDMLGVAYFPTLIIFNRQGTAVWSGYDVAELPDALDQALAKD